MSKIELIQGDCLEKMKDIPDGSIDLIIIDPPYMTTSKKWDKKEVVNASLSKELYRISKNHCSLYVWCGIGEKSQSLIRWFPVFRQDWYFKDLITWKKQRGIGMRKGWLYTREEIMWYVKDNKDFKWNKDCQYGEEKRTFTAAYADPERMAKYKASVKSEYKRLSNVWEDIRETNISWNDKEIETVHFTPKPLKAIERIIKSHTQENETVLDCFMGSGTTGLACKNLNRNFIGIELDPEYFKIAEKRINENI